MNDLETAIREVLSELAEQAVPSTVPVVPARRRRRFRSGSAWRWAVPAAASALVTVIAVVALVAPGDGHRAGAPRPESVPVAGPAPASPDFVVVVRGGRGPGERPTSVVEVRDASAGRVVATVPTPREVAWFAGVTAARDNRLFFLDAVLGLGENTQRIYRLRLGDRGEPADLRPVDRASFTMSALPVLAAAPDGTRLMWTDPMRGVLTVLDLATGRSRVFAIGGVSAIDPSSTLDGARAITFDGRNIVSMAAGTGRTRRSPLPAGVVAAAFAGDSIIAESVASNGRTTSVDELRNGTIRVSTETWDERNGSWGTLDPDGGGRHVLLQKDGRLARYDLDTGVLRTFPLLAGKGVSGGAAW
ncbi:hypothetical protein [Actinomadura gamaensis]|uniref:Uncharacterized protein n=1 Tax=Actinomadura gamaensis TaxID=1763541 RepID=A0ABV9TWW4_9ACTN